MSESIDPNRFASEFFDILDETFENHHGIYLDRGTSLFDTLETVSAEQASQPVGGRCASLAAQVSHVIFYLEVLERHIKTGDAGKVDWSEIWRTVEAVSPQEWAAINQKLRETYHRVKKLLQGITDWNGETAIGGALAIVVHSAYHLGEIRQALCTLA